MKFFTALLAIWFLPAYVSAKTHTWYYTTGWVTANPDGVFEREMVGWNGTWPLPIFTVATGDRINLYLTNGFTDRNTSLHFHGMFQNGSSQMDGPEMITQCPIPPGQTMLYNFTVADQVGTFWYHSHTKAQYGDGMRGAFLITDPNNPYADEFDEEVILSVGDHYHKTTDEIMPTFLNRYNPTGAEPIPQNSLFNETRNATWKVEPGKTYLLHIVNVGMFVSQYLYLEDHDFTVVEVDGIYVEKNVTSMIYITVAQRYSVLITTKNSTSQNYAFMAQMDSDLLDTIPTDLIINSTNYMVYNEDVDLPTEYFIDDMTDFMDDFYLTPVAKYPLLDDPDHIITLDVQMDNLGDGINYAFFNNVTFTAPKVPILMTALSAGDLATNELVYGSNTHPVVLQKDDIIEIVLNNHDGGTHPFHLHGHAFQIIERAPASDVDIISYNSSDHAEWPAYPVVRDTAYIRPQSYMVLRFKADNPGVWYFHCHIEWHLEQGLAIVFIEAPLEIQSTESQALTDDSINNCKGNSLDYKGNAAANSQDYLDLTGQNVQVKPLPTGFTARGIVALVFSCITAFLGLASIGYYGMADIPDVEARVARDLDIDFDTIDDDDIERTSEDQPLRSSSERGKSTI